jgi:hypothetical protein
VLRGPRGFGCLTGGGPEVVTHGGSVTASTVAAKGWRRKKVLHGGGGVLPFIGEIGGWKKAP